MKNFNAGKLLKSMLPGGKAKAPTEVKAPVGVAVTQPVAPATAQAKAPASAAFATPQEAVWPCLNGCGWTAFGKHGTCCSRCTGADGPHTWDCASKNQRIARTPLAPEREASRPAGPKACRHDCGWTAFGKHDTCCALCSSASGPHAKDCATKNTCLVPLCERGCGRKAFGHFATCCTRCGGPDGPHSWDCLQKRGKGQSLPSASGGADLPARTPSSSSAGRPPITSGGSSAPPPPPTTSSGADPAIPTVHGRALCVSPGCSKPAWNGEPGEFCSRTCKKASLLSGSTADLPAAGTAAATAPGRPTGPHADDGAAARTNCTNTRLSRDEVLEDLRCQLVEWHEAGAMRSEQEINDVLESLAQISDLDIKAVRMLWHGVARQVRRIGKPVGVYVDLALQHHGVKVEIIDLGQYSARHHSSCMFLTCAAAVADRRLRGFADAELPGALGAAIDAASPIEQTMSIEDLVLAHRNNCRSMLGAMADALREAACQVLASDKDAMLPYFHPVHSYMDADASEAAYDAWLKKLAGDEEGDELVMLALAQLLGMAIQAVQQSGYRVPVMDPTDAAKDDCVLYWGNDDKHWVWLRVVDS